MAVAQTMPSMNSITNRVFGLYCNFKILCPLVSVKQMFGNLKMLLRLTRRQVSFKWPNKAAEFPFWQGSSWQKHRQSMRNYKLRVKISGTYVFPLQSDCLICTLDAVASCACVTAHQWKDIWCQSNNSRMNNVQIWFVNKRFSWF